MKDRFKVSIDEAVSVVAAYVKSGKKVTIYRVGGEYMIRTSKVPLAVKPGGKKAPLSGAAKTAHDAKALAR